MYLNPPYCSSSFFFFLPSEFICVKYSILALIRFRGLPVLFCLLVLNMLFKQLVVGLVSLATLLTARPSSSIAVLERVATVPQGWEQVCL